MSGDLERFRATYAELLGRQVSEPGEEPLRRAYELGRDAVAAELGVLDLAAVHHEVLGERLGADVATDGPMVARAAGDVFQEVLSAFEMVQRGYREARETVLVQRRQAALVRQLSTFLADASLALEDPGSVDELLRLVAEQAGELVGATCCVIAMQRPGRDDLARAVTCEEGDEGAWAALAAALEPAAAGPWRLEGAQLREHPALAGSALPPPRGWLAAPLTALDGRALGAIHLFDKRSGAFSDVDEAVVVNLGQMASAAVERALLYRGRGG